MPKHDLPQGFSHRGKGLQRGARGVHPVTVQRGASSGCLMALVLLPFTAFMCALRKLAR
jgi:hypothetical protein